MGSQSDFCRFHTNIWLNIKKMIGYKGFRSCYICWISTSRPTVTHIHICFYITIHELLNVNSLTYQGKYLLLRDPNKPIMRLYDIPDNSFESDESDSEDDDDEGDDESDDDDGDESQKDEWD